MKAQEFDGFKHTYRYSTPLPDPRHPAHPHRLLLEEGTNFTGSLLSFQKPSHVYFEVSQKLTLGFISPWVPGATAEISGHLFLQNFMKGASLTIKPPAESAPSLPKIYISGGRGYAYVVGFYSPHTLEIDLIIAGASKVCIEK